MSSVKELPLYRRNLTTKHHSNQLRKSSSPLLRGSTLRERGSSATAAAAAATVHLLYRVGLDFGQNRSDIREFGTRPDEAKGSKSESLSQIVSAARQLQNSMRSEQKDSLAPQPKALHRAGQAD